MGGRSASALKRSSTASMKWSTIGSFGRAFFAAAKSARERGSPVKIAVEVGDSEARIRVENTGPPLPEGPAAEQLFAPMRSGRKRTRERHLGLGLYVARVIAEHHGGSIRAWNADASRVVFEVTIRRAEG